MNCGQYPDCSLFKNHDNVILINNCTESKYLTLEFSGNYDHKKVMSSLDTSATICKDEKYSRILLDFLKLGVATATLMNKFDLGIKTAKTFTNPNFVKIAGLVKIEQHKKFAEDVAANRGAIIKVFYNKEKAIEWLLQ